MPEPQVDLVQAFSIPSTIALSIVTGFYLLYLHSRGSVFPYTPRRPVPWGVVACALAIVALLAAFSTAMEKIQPPVDVVKPANDEHVEPKERAAGENPEADKEAGSQALGAVFYVFVVFGFLFVIAVLYRATPTDLGLPESMAQFAHDVGVGGVACVAALAPVHLIQVLLRMLLQMKQGESGHELIKMMTEGDTDFTFMIMATILAIVVAPLCEEVTFRLLLQGWLEKWEDKKVGWRSPRTEVATDSEIPSAPFSAASTGGDKAIATAEPRVEMPPPTDPPERGLLGLSYGWLPILISATLFGLAHVGYGPEPIPIFVLGLFLGYLYQRTHRITPSIACHAVFNLFTIAQLWWLYLGAKH